MYLSVLPSAASQLPCRCCGLDPCLLSAKSAKQISRSACASLLEPALVGWASMLLMLSSSLCSCFDLHAIFCCPCPFPPRVWRRVPSPTTSTPICTLSIPRMQYAGSSLATALLCKEGRCGRIAGFGRALERVHEGSRSSRLPRCVSEAAIRLPPLYKYRAQSSSRRMTFLAEVRSIRKRPI